MIDVCPHLQVHGGLLAIRGNEDHEKACKDHGIDKIDLLVVNLYPFQVTCTLILRLPAVVHSFVAVDRR